MILHIVKCDMCEATYKFEPMDRLDLYNNAPKEWLVLVHAKDLPTQEGWHFCSKNCLKRWLQETTLHDEEA